MSTAPACTSPRSPHAESCGALALKPVDSGDEAALLAIFASTRQEEREQFGWPESQWDAFIRQQFIAQHTQYSTAYANPSFSLVMRGGEVAGRLYVDRGSQEIRVVDIALLPAHRRQGVGRQLLQDLIDESDALGIALGLHVEKNNPILDFYRHLGFVTEADRGVYWYMCRPARPATGPDAEDFSLLVGTDFRLHLDGLASVALHLQDAHTVQGLHTRTCSLYFTGPDIGRPAHDTYQLFHERLGRFALFMGPVMGAPAGQVGYQALYTRVNTMTKEDTAA
jgi:ribosomal protein S18 acetylase RimI-like enzyme